MQRELVERARDGDHEAFTQLVKAGFPRLKGVAFLVLRDNDRAEDAVQEAFVAAWQDLRALRDPDAWDAWTPPTPDPDLLPVREAGAAADRGRAAREARPDSDRPRPVGRRRRP